MDEHKATVSKKKKWKFGYKKQVACNLEKSPESDGACGLDLKVLIETKNLNLKAFVKNNKCSRLSPALLDILKKSVALGYFLDFLKERNQKHLLDFWLEAETFRIIFSEHQKSICTLHHPPDSAQTGCHTDDKDTFLDKFSKLPIGLLGNVGVAGQEPCENNGLLVRKRCNSRTCGIIESSTDFILFDGECRSSLGSGKHWTRSHDDVRPYPTAGSSSADSFSKLMFKNEWRPFASDDLCSNQTREGSCTSAENSKSLLRQRSRSRCAVVDAVAIYTKYISLDAELSIHLSSQIRTRVEINICKDKENVDPDCFVESQKYVFDALSSIHSEFLQSHYLPKYQLHLLQGPGVSVEDVIHEETALFYFTEFLDQCGFKLILQFYIMAENFERDLEERQKTASYDILSAVEDAMTIYDKFFSMRCAQPLIRDAKLRIVIENNICREDGPQPNCFCIPMAYASTVLSEIYYPLFVKSDVYVSYLENLKRASIDCAGSVGSSRSDQDHVVKQSESPSMTARSESILDLHDLDDFWFHTKPSSGLSLGFINEYGVYSSEMEPEPVGKLGAETSSGSSFGRAMKDFLRGGKGETQAETEELAWERARKIVSDIQRQTLGQP